jgi:Asp-tRNA(Asn)/Glu-tRNA(Gln) amidotransferase A subunit family amidase
MLKDTINSADKVRTSAGSLALAANLAPHDAHEVDALLFTQPEIIAPITRFPSMTIPIGSQENSIPIGAYWIAKRHDEATLLRITFAAESLLGVKCVPEMLDRLKTELDGHEARS